MSVADKEERCAHVAGIKLCWVRAVDDCGLNVSDGPYHVRTEMSRPTRTTSLRTWCMSFACRWEEEEGGERERCDEGRSGVLLYIVTREEGRRRSPSQMALSSHRSQIETE